ncbi:MAG TPA: type II toxin-antitoxin system Phd/YefM family antitoxin [Bryobacteraceae bacterium]|jgi:antitoxin (DNA-binding transcriptional repressor) of toxin-antitoxin stability system|nr:type II toxin-antitoxin system Phd/YefM family antitoxin [Bryobacteraceae bacterium]
MQEVKIAELKARLSYYLRLAENGEEILVKDRERPIARVVALQGSKPRLPIIPARLTRAEAQRLLDKMPKPDLSKITPEVIEETLRWMRRDRSDDWFKK